jgi:hypothetical protein
VLRGDAQPRVVLLCGETEIASWPLDVTVAPDLSLVDALARMQLAARRIGCAIRLQDGCRELAALLDLVGLSDVLPRLGGRPLEAGREAEGGEQGGVEEVVVPDDPVA